MFLVAQCTHHSTCANAHANPAFLNALLIAAADAHSHTSTCPDREDFCTSVHIHTHLHTSRVTNMHTQIHVRTPTRILIPVFPNKHNLKSPLDVILRRLHVLQKSFE